MHTLCPSRWKVRGDALAAFIGNYTELWILPGSRLQGVKAVVSTFQFLLSCSLDKIILKKANN